MKLPEDLNEVITEVSASVTKIVDEALRPFADRLTAIEMRATPAEPSKTRSRKDSVASPTDGRVSDPHEELESKDELTSSNTIAPSRDMKKDILEAAVELFYQRGFEATGVQEIVNQAGCTKGALYHYFRSKNDILFELRNAFIGDLLSRGNEIRNGDHTATEALSLIIRELILLVKERRAYMAVAFLETRIDFEHQPKAGADRNEWKGILEDLISRGQRSGEFRPEIDLNAAAAHVAMCSWAAFHWLPEETTNDVEGVIAVFTELTLRGLARGE